MSDSVSPSSSAAVPAGPQNGPASVDADASHAFEPAPAQPQRPRKALSPSEQMEYERRRQRLLMLALRTLFMLLLVTASLLPFVGSLSKFDQEFSFLDYIIPFLATFTFGAIVVAVDAAIPNKRLASVFGIYLGLIAGLVGAIAFGALLDLVAGSWDLKDRVSLGYLSLIKLALGITMCYLAVSIVLTTKDDFRLVIPYVEFSKQMRGVRPLLLDTSALIDGRIDGMVGTGFLDAPLVVPQFVIEELQTLADSSDKLKRARGRRGLSVVSKLQTNPYVDVTIDNADIPRKSVDHMLLHMASDQNLRILTTDYNLNKVAQIHGVTVLNLNDLANAVKSQVIPGEVLTVEVVKPGEGPGQGVGYMPDGTMVVIEEAADRLGQTVAITVTNSLQTSAGRMIFGQVRETGNADPNSHVEDMARAATHQPRAPVRAGRADDGPSRRNPRR